MRYKNWIGGKWVEAKSGKYFSSTNPADPADVLGEFPRSDRHDVETAVKAADRAFAEWSRVPAPKRGELLFEVAKLLKERKEELSQLMTREMGKVLKEARGDVQEGVDMTYYIAAEGRRLHGYVTPSELPHKTCYAVRRPIGRIAVITPWNFPLAIPTWKIMPALVAGNTVVWKPASDTPRLAYELAKIFDEVGLPDGVLNLVIGDGNSVGIPLAQHPKINMINFTGSTDIGREIYKYGAGKLNKVHLEMGGKNPIIVMDDADLELALDGILWSAFGTSGQRCTACSRLIIHRPVYKPLLNLLAERTKKLKLGNGLDPKTDVGPVVNPIQLKRIHEYVELGMKEGADLLIGGKVAKKGELAKGSFYEPTIFADVSPDMRIFQEEIFGPVLAATPAKDYDEAIRLANDTTYGLSSSIFTRDIYQAQRAIEDLETGITYVNAGTIGAEVHLPFGGIKDTGNGGREAGQTALDECCEWKTVYIDYSGRLQKAQGID
ncbi:MAG: aldehyde dehydrogenase [Candidatus Fraserbacteria bacterium RBG_16_55_9]|uniref:aldehyde dehydrogenase (NAD(+)) n=1 Tax=Fraserbacteria sp. (strain RBG_16_55_9) TaxID=1817864 RepID=A0A1F5UY37_FRAXR|nr:MAG: aldehyde dehydrogenase [Candidatus Fraserbacteria bacterium RBG_16_55_9]